MLFRFAMEDIFERVADQRWDYLEVGDFDVGAKNENARRQRVQVFHNTSHDVLKPSVIGFPICMPSRQTDGPCCPRYSLLSSLGGAGSASVPASVMGTSPSRVTGTKPYDVGMIAFGVSSPAYPARSVDVPMSSTRAETSSGCAESQRHALKGAPFCFYVGHTTSVLHHASSRCRCRGCFVSLARFNSTRSNLSQPRSFHP